MDINFAGQVGVRLDNLQPARYKKQNITESIEILLQLTVKGNQKLVLLNRVGTGGPVQMLHTIFSVMYSSSSCVLLQSTELNQLVRVLICPQNNILTWHVIFAQFLEVGFVSFQLH